MLVRIIAGVVLLPLLLLVVLFAPKICISILFGVMAAIGAYELLRGTGFVKETRLNIYAMVIAFWVCLWCGLSIGYAWLLLGVLLFFVLLFAEVMISRMELEFYKVAVCLVGGLVLPVLLGSLVRIHCHLDGRFYIFIPFILAFMSDTGAYFSGCFFGKHKLAPVISPKKTIEGLVGGVIATMLAMVVYCLIMKRFFGAEVSYIYALIYGLLGSLAGVFGDLCFSVIKRQTGIKDYGNLIPGHGGILDRFDSMMLVGPLAEVMILLIPVVVVK